MGTPDGKILVIGGNQKKYAASLAVTKESCKGTQFEQLKKELKKLAGSGDAYALYLLSTIDRDAGQVLLKRAARGGSPEAIRNLVPAGFELNTLPLESQLEYACRYPLSFAVIRDKMNRESALFRLYSQYSSKKDPASAFAYAELLLRPYLKVDFTVKVNAEKAMLQAAEHLPVAQAQYVIRFLNGDYGNMTTAKKFIKKLMLTHRKELFVKELFARLLEKEKPGKNLKAWQILYREKSAIAAYFLGDYALRLGKKQAAAQFRFNFLEWDHAKRIKHASYLFPGLRGQFFQGFLEN